MLAEVRVDHDPLLEYVIAKGPTMIFRRTVEGVVTFVSPNNEGILGYTPEEVVEVPGFWAAHVHADDQDGFPAEAAETPTGEAPEAGRVYRFLHSDGGYRWL